MNRVHCNAPWVGVCFLPGGKYAPCCAYGDAPFDSIETMTSKIGSQFQQGEIPKGCVNSCPPNQPGWRDQFNRFDTDYQTHKIRFLDFRNNNLCNMKCRSCGPVLSSSWASEAKIAKIHSHQHVDIDSLDLSQCNKIYFAGGEPLLNPQHYEVLDTVIAKGQQPDIMYSTNLSVLSYKNKHIEHYWSKLPLVMVHVSIDAVGKHAEVVRSDTDWSTVSENLNWLRQQQNVWIRIATVLSAVNIWFVDSLFEYFEWIDRPHAFEPVLANVDSIVGLCSIPYQYRLELKQSLANSRFNQHPNIQRAIDCLQQNNYNETNWYRFLSQQLILDNYRKENWFDLLPQKHKIYQQALNV